jgi:hypothetical protein
MPTPSVDSPLDGVTPDVPTTEPLVARLTTGHTSAALTCIGWALFAVLALVGIGQLFIGVDPQDEGQLLTYPWLVAHGIMPYRHIWMSYPPGTYLVLAALMKLGLPGLVAERGLSVVVRLLYVLLVNRALTGSWRRFSWLGTSTSFSLLFLSSGARAYPWVVGMPLLLLGLLASRDRARLAAALFFAAGMFRFEVALAGCVVLLSLAALDRMDRTWAPRRLEAGLALVAATGFFHLALSAVTAGQALRDIFLDPIFAVDPAHRLPLLPPYFGPAGVPLELLVVGGPPLLIVLGLLHKRPYVVATNLGVLTLLSQFFQRADWQHLFAAGAISVPWMLFGFAELLQPENRVHRAVNSALDGVTRHQQDRAASRLITRTLAAVGLVVGAWYSIVVLSYGVYLSPLSPVSSESLYRNWSQHVVHAGSSTIIASSRGEARDDTQLVAYFHRYARSSQQLFIAPTTLRYDIYNQTALYYVLGLHPASRYLEMLPGLEKRATVQNQIIVELRNCNWIVLWKGGFSPEPNSSVVPGSALLEHFVRTQYRLVLQNQTYEVLRRSTPSY